MGILSLVGIKQENMLDNTLVEDLFNRTTADANSGQSIVGVAVGANFTVGESVIVYDCENNFETACIQGINGNNLTMTQNLVNAYLKGSIIGKYLGVLDTSGGGKYLRPIAPELGTGADGAFVSTGNTTWSAEKNFSSVLIKAGHTIAVSGNFEIKCQGSFEIEAGGKLSAKGMGHAGGYGGNYGSSGAGNGGGNVYQLKNTGHGGGGAGVASGTDAAGGGGGAYGSNGIEGGWSGSSSNKGIGGVAYNDPAMTNKEVAYLMGSGGGGGGSALNISGSGGNGGGIIRISCRNLIVSGEIDCDGNPGSDGVQPQYKTGGGGGGAGGTIMIMCLLNATFGTNLIHSRGGVCGRGWNGATIGYHNGGDGGYGRVRIEAGSLSGSTYPGYATGYLNGASGRTKYGWYITKEIMTGTEAMMVNCIVRQNIIINQALSSSAVSGQANMAVASASSYEAGDVAILKEGNKQEIKKILSINANTLTFDSNLESSYTVAGRVARIDVIGLVSLVLPGQNESFEEMGLMEVVDIGGSQYEITFAKAVKINGDDRGGNRMVGMVRLKGKKTGETDLVAVTQVNWIWF